jgi:hypothetical protein
MTLALSTGERSMEAGAVYAVPASVIDPMSNDRAYRAPAGAPA